MQNIRQLAALVSRADAALTAATLGRGVDSHQAPLVELPDNLLRACESIEAAARVVARLRASPPVSHPLPRRGFLERGRVC